MSDFPYRALRLIGAPFRYRLLGAERLPRGGPAIYVANHLASVGPVRTILSFPLRLHPWVVAEMADPRRAPAYLYDDFVEPVWRLTGRAGRIVSSVVARVAVGLIRGIGSIPVEREMGLFDASVPRSLALLRSGRSLLIFPEDNKAAMDPETNMRPFCCGFVWLCFLYEGQTGRRLPVCPLAVSPERRAVLVGRPRYLVVEEDRRRSIRALCSALEGDVARMYLSLRRGDPLDGERVAVPEASDEGHG
ncbi:MAG: hypothetical protein FJZ90_05240 [Chloroflexi bacterium]|nr:hypothetical protein [Chloroflexota bacterium]